MITIKKQNATFSVDPETGSHVLGGFWNHVISNSWEEHTFEVIKNVLKEDKSYVDFGAWIGPTLLFAANFAKKCYGFEPDPKAFNFLQKNISLNHFENIEAYQIAISDTCGKGKMGTRSQIGDSCSSILFNEKFQWDIEMITIEECFKIYDIKNCGLIKMDIEGGEAIAIPSMSEFLKQTKIPLYLATHGPWIPSVNEFSKLLFDTLSCYDYHYVSIGRKNKKMKQISKNEIEKYAKEFSEILSTNEHIEFIQ